MGPNVTHSGKKSTWETDRLLWPWFTKSYDLLCPKQLWWWKKRTWWVKQTQDFPPWTLLLVWNWHSVLTLFNFYNLVQSHHVLINLIKAWIWLFYPKPNWLLLLWNLNKLQLFYTLLQRFSNLNDHKCHLGNCFKFVLSQDSSNFR